MVAAHQVLALRWLERLHALLPIAANDVFPTDHLLDHIPTLIVEIADYVREPTRLEFAANTMMMSKARELGELRYRQRASVHQLLREYRILGGILTAFVQEEAEQIADVAPAEAVSLLSALTQAVGILEQATVETFIGKYSATIERQTTRMQNFNQMVSHELRQPIGALQFALKLADTATDAEDRARYRQVVERNLLLLNSMIDRLAAISRLAGPDAAHIQKLELGYVAREVARQLRDMAEARGVEIRVVDGFPSMTLDVAVLELILINLVSNSIKYSNPDVEHKLVEIFCEDAADSLHRHRPRQRHRHRSPSACRACSSRPIAPTPSWTPSSAPTATASASPSSATAPRIRTGRSRSSRSRARARPSACRFRTSDAIRRRKIGTDTASIMSEPGYPAARSAAAILVRYFERQLRDRPAAATPPPDADAIEAIIDAAFWASLRREEGFAPKISLAFLRPEHTRTPLRFERQLTLAPAGLAKLAPAVERPGIHLGVWADGDELRVWGTTRDVPLFCFVLEVAEPGLLVVKHRRTESGKFVNVLVLQGDSLKVVDEARVDAAGLSVAAAVAPRVQAGTIGERRFRRAGRARGVDAGARPRRLAARRAGRLGAVARVDPAARRLRRHAAVQRARVAAQSRPAGRPTARSTTGTRRSTARSRPSPG